MKNQRMMKHLLLFFLLLATNLAYAQETFTIDGFSNEYYGKLYISDTKEVFSPGWVAVYDKKTNRQLIKIESDELTFNLHEGKIQANVKELPYGEQSQIMYDDFNFDGKNDFAIMDGQNSCYHGPSFQIFLATDRGFKHSPEFTTLAQEYCGMFQVDHQEKKISTMTKSGCCWHQFSDFIVQNNKPIPIKVVEEGLSTSGILWNYVGKVRVNGKMVEKKYSVFNADMPEENILYYFEFNNGKKVRLLKQDETLNYVFTDKDDTVELLYADSFSYSKAGNFVQFAVGKTAYKITSSGITVTTPARDVDMAAKPETRKGSLTALQGGKLKNVVLE